MNLNTLVETGREKLKEIRNYLNSLFVEREEVIEGLLIALVGRFNVFLWGPAGTGKTKLAEAVASCVSGGKVFDINFHKQMDAAELLGPWNPVAFKEGRYRRNTEGYIQDAVVAIADEIDKAGIVTQALLTIMNERVYKEGGNAIPIPLRVMIGASNAPMTDPALQPFMDRFHMKYALRYITNIEKFKQMLQISVRTRTETPPPPQITVEELVAMQEYAATLPVAEEAIDKLCELRMEAEKAERIYSDRRWAQILHAAQVRVVIEGEDDIVFPHHLSIVKPFLTTRENDMDLVKLINAVIPPPPLKGTGQDELRQRFEQIRQIRKNTERVDALRRLLADCTMAARNTQSEELRRLRAEIIHELNNAMR